MQDFSQNPRVAAHGKTWELRTQQWAHMLISPPLRNHKDLVTVTPSYGRFRPNPSQSLASMHYHQVNFNMGSHLGHSNHSQITAPSKSKMS